MSAVTLGFKGNQAGLLIQQRAAVAADLDEFQASRPVTDPVKPRWPVEERIRMAEMEEADLLASGVNDNSRLATVFTERFEQTYYQSACLFELLLRPPQMEGGSVSSLYLYLTSVPPHRHQAYITCNDYIQVYKKLEKLSDHNYYVYETGFL